MCLSTSLNHLHASFQFYKIPAFQLLFGEIAVADIKAASCQKYMKTN